MRNVLSKQLREILFENEFPVCIISTVVLEFYCFMMTVCLEWLGHSSVERS